MATLKEKLFGIPTIDYGSENQAFINELAKQQEFQNLAQNQGLTTQQALGGVMQGLNYGNKDIAQRQQQLGINVPQNEEELALAREGNLNDYTTRKGGFLNDLASGFKENYTQGFNVNNLQPQNKGIATKIGEGFGSLARFYDKPIGRFALATGLSMLTDNTNPLNEGINAYVGRQNNMVADKVYRNQLKQLGMSDEELNAIKGNVTKDIYAGVTSGMRLGNQRMTYGQLAMLDDEIAEELRKNPALANQFVPINIARDIYSKKRGQAEGKMEKVKAETDKIKKDTKLAGTPKKIIHISTDKKTTGSGRPQKPNKVDYKSKYGLE